MTRTLAPILAVLLASALPALAQDDHSGHAGHAMGHDAGHDMAHSMAGADSPASRAFAEANARMHQDMAIPLTGNPDADFIAGMIPHHQGAVDMARIVLQYGTDPEVKAFAQKVIDAQEAEIAWMKDWLAKNGQ